MIFIAVFDRSLNSWGNRTFSVIKSNDFQFKVPYGWYRYSFTTDGFSSYCVEFCNCCVIFNLPLPAFHIYLIAHYILQLVVLQLCGSLCFV